MPNAITKKLLHLFNVRPAELPLVGLMLLYALLMGIPGIITETTSYALFLERFSAQSIPYIYIGFALVATALGLLFTRLEPKLSRSTLFLALLAAIAIPILIFRLLLAFSSADWPVIGLTIWADATWVFINLAFWGLATHLFTLRQGKRLFGLLGAGLIASEVVTGLMIPLLVSFIGTVNLLLVAVIAIVGALVVQTIIVRGYDHHLNPQDDERLFFEEKAWWQLVHQPYIALIFGLAALNLMAYFFIDNLFYIQVEHKYADIDTLAGFIGTFFASAGLLTATLGALVSGRFLNRYGLQAGLLVLPVVLLVGIGLTIGARVMPPAGLLLFWMVIGVKLSNEVLKDSTNEAATLVLYQPLPAGQRMQIQTAVESIIRPLAAGITGLLLLLMSAVLPTSGLYLEIGVAILLIGWLALAVILAKKYTQVLMKTLTRRKLDGAVLTLEDETSLTTLEQALHHPSPQVALYALNMLRADRAIKVLPELLYHPADEVRQAALLKIEQMHLTTAIEAVEQCLTQAEAVHIKTSAMRTLAAIDNIKALEQIFPYLDASDTALRQGAITCVINYGNPELAMVAEGRLLHWVVSLTPTDRINAAKIIGDVSNRNLHHPLRQLLRDDDCNVQRAALAAAGKTGYPQLWSDVVAALDSPTTRGAAAAALVAGGEAALPVIQTASNRPDLPPATQLRLIRVISRIGGPQATTLLLQHLNTPHEALRMAILTGLDHLDYEANAQEQPWLMQQIEREVGQAAWLLAAMADLEQVDPTNEATPSSLPFLLTVLRTQLARALDRIFFCLSFLYKGEGLLKIRNTLTTSSAEQRAYALEMLDTILPSPLKQQILPLVEPLSSAQRLNRLRLLFPQEQLDGATRLIRLLDPSATDVDDVWLWICTIHTIGTLPQFEPHLKKADLLDSIAPHLSAAPDTLMVETAAWTLARINAAAQFTARWPQLTDALPSTHPINPGEIPMLSTLEKVIFLKNVNLFKETPDEILTQLATLLEEVEVPAETAIFEKGAPGDCMYIIISGQVEVHDGDHILNVLTAGDVFGEIALLDAQARLASVVAETDTHLLRLDQEPFYELMEDHIEVVRGVIVVLSGYLRDLLTKVDPLEAQSSPLEEFKSATLKTE
ncbi:MAG: cyclic nucleotide-binding domain-containing protein [Anaerolineae bacterium]|nr:cyclic nucleotide-binding domain-containing protein [Anaerolineae bacterium]